MLSTGYHCTKELQAKTLTNAGKGTCTVPMHFARIYLERADYGVLLQQNDSYRGTRKAGKGRKGVICLFSFEIG